MLNPQNIVLNDINELKVKVVLTLLTISKFANLGQEIQRVWRRYNLNLFTLFQEFFSYPCTWSIGQQHMYAQTKIISIIEQLIKRIEDCL